MIPSLNSVGTITVLAIKSAPNIKTAPKKADAGITILLSGPVTSLTMCGTIMPTKAIMPQTATDTEVSRVVIIKSVNLVLLTLRPNVVAESSFKQSILILWEYIRSNGKQIINMGAIIRTCSHLES